MSTMPIRVWLARESTMPERVSVRLTKVLAPGPNPWKVILILEELEIPYEIKSVKFQDIKSKPFIDLNPNGRVPGES